MALVYALAIGILLLSSSSAGAQAGYLGQFAVLPGGWGIAVDHQGNVITSGDGDFNQISVFSPDGFPLHTWGPPGTGNGQLRSPLGIAVDHDDNIYVED